MKRAYEQIKLESISVILYVLSLIFPVIYNDFNPLYGYHCLIFGAEFSFKFELLGFVWLANPILIISYIVPYENHSVKFILAFIALVQAASFLLIMDSVEEFDFSLNWGYFVWLASFVFQLVNCYKNLEK